MKLSFKRGQKGFTLVELMVVVGILAVLMTIVVPAVTGTKSTSITGQVQSDADAVQKSMDNFQNKGVTPLYPEVKFDATADANGEHGGLASYKLPDGTKLFKKGNNTSTPDIIVVDTKGGTADQLGTTANYAGGTTAAYQEIDWNATTKVWQSNGTVNTAYFVPDFLVKQPSSVGLNNDEGLAADDSTTKLAEFLWLVKVNNYGSNDASRTLEVYRLQDWTSGDVATYKQIF